MSACISDTPSGGHFDMFVSSIPKRSRDLQVIILLYLGCDQCIHIWVYVYWWSCLLDVLMYLWMHLHVVICICVCSSIENHS